MEPLIPCWQMRYVDYMRMVQMRNRAIDLIPSLLVITLAVLPQREPNGDACMTDLTDEASCACYPTDSAQFRCFLSSRD